ncbi:hypothetical protein KS4_32620 [Poriferisphaera corsica]|uniref:Uncharacterized protein n=1 Tax=Poriferisphaera corsica TaxID=2528020 RepID=A0A517YY72_9BACT|nr:hypothetical protein [Poriferisphaera corsica]QDU35182.1 hypothetical protein KS4_32620 [Poriferisphaera corsica]
MNPMIRLITATITIVFVLYVSLGHEGGLMMSHVLAIVGLLMIGFGLTKHAQEQHRVVEVRASTNERPNK